MFLAQVSKGRRGIRGVSTDAPAMDDYIEAGEHFGVQESAALLAY